MSAIDRSAGCLALTLASCLAMPDPLPARELPRIAPGEPATEGERIALGSRQIEPMYRECLAIDLPTVVSVALARNLEIESARERVRAQHGRLGVARGSLFPSLLPGLAFESADGSVRATEGELVDVSFHTTLALVAAAWILNPGAVHHDLVAARRRLDAELHAEQAVRMETLRLAALGYYDLVLAQLEIASTREAVAEAEELLRITRARVQAGTGLAADEARVRAELASRRQDLLRALQAFHSASVALSTTLDLDPTVTLAPSVAEIALAPLVGEDRPIEELLELAAGYREDLRAVLLQAEAALSQEKAARWRSLGPTVLVAGQVGSIRGQADGVSGLGDVRQGPDGQARLAAGIGWKLDSSQAGAIAIAEAAGGLAGIQARRKLQEVRAEVVREEQESRTQRALALEARAELEAAEEALRLARANLQAGTMTTLDVLHAQNALERARSRQAAAVVRYDQAQVRLLAALGLLDERALLAGEAPREER